MWSPANRPDPSAKLITSGIISHVHDRLTRPCWLIWDKSCLRHWMASRRSMRPGWWVAWGSLLPSLPASSYFPIFSPIFFIELCQYQQENSINCQKGKTFGKLLVLWTKDLWFNQKSNPNKWNRVGKGKNQQAVHRYE